MPADRDRLRQTTAYEPGALETSASEAVATPVLTPRQRQVLRLSALGRPARVAAVELGISPQTIKNHLEDIYRKTDSHTLVDALRAVGWLRVP